MSSPFRTLIKAVVNDPREGAEFQGQIVLMSSGETLTPPRDFEDISAADTWASDVNEGLEFAASRVLASFYLYRQPHGSYHLSMHRPEVKEGEWSGSYIFLPDLEETIWEVLNYKLKREELPPGSCVDLTTGTFWTVTDPQPRQLERVLDIRFSVYGAPTRIGQQPDNFASLERAREERDALLKEHPDKRFRIIRTTLTEIE